MVHARNAAANMLKDSNGFSVICCLMKPIYLPSMRTVFLIFLFSTLSNVLCAQKTFDDGSMLLTQPFESIQDKVNADSVLLRNECTSPPEFPGFEAFVEKHLKYPKLARKKGFQGTVKLLFVVEKDGSISRIRLLSGVYESMDQEAIRLLQLYANKRKIIPGSYHGKPVRAFYEVPVHFVLE